MSNVSGASSGASTGGDRARVMGVPTRCWCREQILAKISNSENNPYRRYYRCAYAYAQKLRNDNHAWKWVDEALLDEIKALGFRAERLEYKLKEISRSRMELEKMVYAKVEMKLEKEIFERVEAVIVETESKMKKMMVLVIFGCVIIVGCSMLLG